MEERYRTFTHSCASSRLAVGFAWMSRFAEQDVYKAQDIALGYVLVAHTGRIVHNNCGSYFLNITKVSDLASNGLN